VVTEEAEAPKPGLLARKFSSGSPKPAERTADQAFMFTSGGGAVASPRGASSPSHGLSEGAGAPHSI
jgi:hypothetical protein